MIKFCSDILERLVTLGTKILNGLYLQGRKTYLSQKKKPSKSMILECLFRIWNQN